ncbi:MAG: alpha/beta hydrolase-fold protein [Parvularculaceae bacterium]
MFVLSALLAAAAAQFSIPDTSVIDMPIAENGVAYQLYVYAPPPCRDEGAKCDTVYLLDAEYSFPLAATMIEHLYQRKRIRPVIAVSIGYKDKTHYKLNRTRDYTPFHFPTGGYGKEFQRVSGGGDAFLKVIKNEIVPYIEENFAASSKNRTLVGHSYGGLFAVNTWIEDPSIFENYVVVSPSLWYADGAELKRAGETCEKAKSGHASSFVLEVGSWEEQPENGAAMVSDLETFNNLLVKCKMRKAETYLRVFEDETHASIFPAALSTGLRKLFGGN